MIKGLYQITPEGKSEEILRVVRDALRGGARVIQYRDKQRPIDDQIRLGRQLAKLCKETGTTFIVNDHPEVALECRADGVHVGQGDVPIHELRRMLGPEKLIGVSTRTVDQALTAEMAGADYVGVGSIFPTNTKEDIELVGLNTLRMVRRALKIPIVAIGGISWVNGADAIEAGADALAVIGATSNDPKPQLAARELSNLFNICKSAAQTRVLTVAGSDAGGGAGIQADLKTISLLGSFGTSAITVLTAQNTLGVHGLSPASADFVTKQINVILSDIGTDTVKTGMLFSAEIVSRVAALIDRYNLQCVIDPVMIAKGGAALLKKDAVVALRKELLPQTYLLTPNIPEAEALTGLKIRNPKEMEDAARHLQTCGVRHVLVKGGHLDKRASDILLAGTAVHHLYGEWTETRSTHGTGCSYSAAIATLLAQGQPLVKAVQLAKTFINEAIKQAVPLGAGHGPINHFAGAKTILGEGIKHHL